MKAGTAVVTLLVLIHHGIAYFHGGAHTALAITMAPWQTAFINVVILIVPLLGVILAWTAWRRAGLYAVVIGMVGGLIFGVYHHYMWVSSDHISHLPSGDAHVHETFIWTAGMIAMFEGFASISAAYLLGCNRPPANPPIPHSPVTN